MAVARVAVRRLIRFKPPISYLVGSAVEDREKLPQVQFVWGELDIAAMVLAVD